MDSYKLNCCFEVINVECSNENEVRITDRDGDQVLLNVVEARLLMEWLEDLFDEHDAELDREFLMEELADEEEEEPELEIIIFVPDDDSTCCFEDDPEYCLHWMR